MNRAFGDLDINGVSFFPLVSFQCSQVEREERSKSCPLPGFAAWLCHAPVGTLVSLLHALGLSFVIGGMEMMVVKCFLTRASTNLI